MSLRMHPDGIKELEESQRRIMRLVTAHVLTAEQGKRQHLEVLKRVCAQAMTEDGEAQLAIKCNGCGKILVVAHDVRTYVCTCSSKERFVSQSRDLRLPIGTDPISHLISGGRDA